MKKTCMKLSSDSAYSGNDNHVFDEAHRDDVIYAVADASDKMSGEHRSSLHRPGDLP